jgi:DNA-binding CsgD family transcriptional regulator
LDGARVTALLRRGRLHEAVELGERVLDVSVSPVNRMHLLLGVTNAQLRLGAPGALERLQEALELGRGNGESAWQVQVAAMAVQAAWLTGDSGLVDDDVLEQLQRTDQQDSWYYGELAVWLQRLGRLPELRFPAAPPYAVELAGDRLAAAACWRHVRFPFEEAAALYFEGSVESLRRALDLFNSIGSEPAAALTRAALRRAGETALARGPRSSTAAHPLGLTRREAEVLELVRSGLSNAQIAKRLVISSRTVDHHVSAVLGKCGVDSRTELAHLDLAGSQPSQT